ncbi:hypothetical protein [Hyphomicrobium sp. MC8b]|jgi:hypothetical protein|uniref:hypothetical protein n=1 Tax=unclassified Hyphomicrobium TaxID=2619925 RepID=UPI00391DDC28
MRTFSEWTSWTAKAVLLSIIPSTSVAVAATSDELFNTYFGNVLGGLPCFAQTFDDRALNANPQQRVRKIEIDLAKTNSDGTPNTPDRFTLGFAVMLASGSDWFGQRANCQTNDDDFECYLESDGGIFRLSPQKTGLKLVTGDDGISVDDGDSEVELSGKDGIDKTFDLVPSKEECQDAAAFFEGGND